jgi:hypothetical protein
VRVRCEHRRLSRRTQVTHDSSGLDTARQGAGRVPCRCQADLDSLLPPLKLAKLKLRTGRDNCSSSGSSLCRPVPGPRVVRVMTPPMYQLQVVRLVCSAVAARYDVVFVDEGDVLVRVEPHTTHRALTILPSQQGPSLRRSQCLCEASLLPQLPVVSVVGVQRAALSLDLSVPSDGDLVVPCECLLTIHEVPPAIEVPGPNPGRCLGGVASLRPPPQLGLDMVVHRVKRVFRCAVPVVVGPAPDYRAQVAYDPARGGLPMPMQIVVDGTEMLHHLLFLRSRQDHASKAPRGEAEKVEAPIDVDDAGFRFAQLQSSLSQKAAELGDDIGFQDLTCRCRHHQVVGIADQADAAVCTTAVVRSDVSTLLVLGPKEPFHTVERHIRQQR